MADDSARIAELSAIVQAVRDRVRARYPEPNGLGDPAGHPEVNGAPQPSIRPRN